MKTLTLILASALLALTLTNCGYNPPEVTETSKDILKHSIHNEEVYDAPIKTQITFNVLIEEEEFDEQKVKDLLNYLYNTTISRTGFEYHKNPTNIFIYAYTSTDKLESGMGLWVGMISKSFDDIQPQISINEKQLNSLNEIEEDRWELTTEKRHEVWEKLINLQDKAQVDADKKYPLDKVGLTLEEIGKNTEYVRELNKKYKSELAKEFAINIAIVDSVVKEGFKKGWAFPK